MNEKSMKLINSIIKKTKNGSLHWKILSRSSIALKPNKTDRFENHIVTSAKDAFLPQLSEPDSYVTEYKDGSIFLLLYRDVLRLGNSTISLRIQTKRLSYSVEYASTDCNDSQIATSLKRLYNIVDSADYDIESFIDDFINN